MSADEAPLIDLDDFLLARFAVDEATAKAHLASYPWRDLDDPKADYDEEERATVRRNGNLVDGPYRWLAECEAKRRIVGLHRQTGSLRDPETDAKIGLCTVCGPNEWPYIDNPGGTGVDSITPAPTPAGDSFWPCDTLKLLALPYADHPDYREGWRP